MAGLWAYCKVDVAVSLWNGCNKYREKESRYVLKQPNCRQLATKETARAVKTPPWVAGWFQLVPADYILGPFVGRRAIFCHQNWEISVALLEKLAIRWPEHSFPGPSDGLLRSSCQWFKYLYAKASSCGVSILLVAMGAWLCALPRTSHGEMVVHVKWSDSREWR